MPRSEEKDPNENIARQMRKGYPRAQAIAIGLSEARRAGTKIPRRKRRGGRRK